MLYISETWTVKDGDVKSLEQAKKENGKKWICNAVVKDGAKSEELKSKLGIEITTEVMGE